VQNRVVQMQQGFMAKGFSFNESIKKAYQALDFSVMKQATVMSYMDIFLWLGIMFVCCIPIMLLIKRGKTKVKMEDAMH
jgi:DHA2 family multidrug resistance protein